MNLNVSKSVSVVTYERQPRQREYEHYNDKYMKESNLNCPLLINVQIFQPYLVEI